MKQATIFYDNACGLCNGFVGWIRARDEREIFEFTPLQNTQSTCPVELDSDPQKWSVILLDNDEVWEGSDAVLRIFELLGGIYRLVIVLRIAPRRFRDFVYRFIARHRL